MPHKWIFLCYRRQDSTVQTGRIFDVLNARFPDQVFQDVESIDIGVDWTDELRESLLSADVLIVVVGPEWQSMAAERGPRINDPADYVHIEVRTALEHDIRIIPILLQGATMPKPRTLPTQLEGLLRRQALPLHDATFESDIARLVTRLERVQTEVERVRAQAALQAATRMQQELAARKLAAHAESAAVRSRNLPRAGLLALESMIRFPLPGAHEVLRQARAGLPRLDAQLHHAAEVTVVAESSKGKWIATGSIDGAVKVWDSATLTQVMDFRTGGKVGALAFEPEEGWLAAASDDCKAYVWELPAGRSLSVLETHKPLLKLLAQSDSQTTSLVGLAPEFSHGPLMVWDAKDWKLLWKRDKIADVAGQTRQQLIAIAWEDNVELVWTPSGESLQKFSLQATVTRVAWHQAIQLFAATTLPGALWEGFLAMEGENEVKWQCKRVNGYASPVVPIAFSPKVPSMVVAGNSGIRVLDRDKLTEFSLPLKGQIGIDLRFSKQGTFLAVLSPEDESITAWRLPAGRFVLDMGLETARAICFGIRDSRMISASHENAARVWELPGGEEALWRRAVGATAALIFSPSGDHVAWVGKEIAPDHSVQTNLWKLAVLRAIDGAVSFSIVFEGSFDGIVFDVDSKWVALRSGKVTRVFHLHTGAEVPEMQAAETWFPDMLVPDNPLPESLSERETLQWRWSANRKWMVTRHPGRIRIWDGATQTELTEFPIPADVTGMSISPNEKYLAIGCGDGDLQIRTLPDGIEFAVFPHDGPVTKFAFSPDGNFVVAAGVDADVILMWIVSPEILMEDVRRRLDRDLTREEWELYVGDEPYSETRLAASTRIRKDRIHQGGAEFGKR